MSKQAPPPAKQPPSTAHPDGLEPINTEVTTDEVVLDDGSRMITKITTITYPDGNVCKRTTKELVRMAKVKEKNDGTHDMSLSLRRRGVCCCCIPLHWFPCFRNKTSSNDGGDGAAVEESKVEKSDAGETAAGAGEEEETKEEIVDPTLE
jgi:hypothetical protein